jgi:hypothetical protein
MHDKPGGVGYLPQRLPLLTASGDMVHKPVTLLRPARCIPKKMNRWANERKNAKHSDKIHQCSPVHPRNSPFRSTGNIHAKPHFAACGSMLIRFGAQIDLFAALLGCSTCGIPSTSRHSLYFSMISTDRASKPSLESLAQNETKALDVSHCFFIRLILILFF